MKEYRFRNNLKKSIKKIFIMGLVLAFVTGILKDKINVYANTTKVYNNDDIINTINNMIETVNLKKWDEFTNFFYDDEQKYYYNYFLDNQITDGVKQIISMDVIREYIVNNNEVKDEWLVDEYPDLLTDANKVYSVIAEIKCEVNKENQYFLMEIIFF